MKRTNIYLGEDQLRALKLIAEQRDQPVSALIREAIDAWLQEPGARVIDEDEWQRRFSRLLETPRPSLGLSDDELMDEVNKVVHEVRRSRAARQTGPGGHMGGGRGDRPA